MVQSHEEGDLIDLQQTLRITETVNRCWPLTHEHRGGRWQGPRVKVWPGCGSWRRWSLGTASRCCAGWRKNGSPDGLLRRCHSQPHDSCSCNTHFDLSVNYINATSDSLTRWPAVTRAFGFKCYSNNFLFMLFGAFSAFIHQLHLNASYQSPQSLPGPVRRLE